MIEKCKCNDGFVWNPSICEYECDRPCDAGEYLDYESCKCRNWLIDKLAEECSEYIWNIYEMIYNVSLNDHRKVRSSCTIYIVLFIISFIILMGIGSVSIYSYWHAIESCFNKLP